MNANSWVVSEIVIALFIVITASSLAGEPRLFRARDPREVVGDRIAGAVALTFMLLTGKAVLKSGFRGDHGSWGPSSPTPVMSEPCPSIELAGFDGGVGAPSPRD